MSQAKNQSTTLKPSVHSSSTSPPFDSYSVPLPNTPGIWPLLSPMSPRATPPLSSAHLPASTVVQCPHGSPRTFPLTPPSTRTGTMNHHPFKGPPATPALYLLQITHVLSTSGPHFCCALCLEMLFSAGRAVTRLAHSGRSGCSVKGHPGSLATDHAIAT